MRSYIPRRAATDPGHAYTSSNGRVWISWGGDIFAFMIALGRLSFTIDAKNADPRRQP